MKTKPVVPSKLMIQLREDVLKVIEPYQEKLDSAEILAIIAYTTGQCLAFQDQTKMTVAMAMTVVQDNLVAGNRHAIESALGETKGTA